MTLHSVRNWGSFWFCSSAVHGHGVIVTDRIDILDGLVEEGIKKWMKDTHLLSLKEISLKLPQDTFFYSTVARN